MSLSLTNRYAPPLPEWVVVLVQQDAFTRSHGLHMGIRARDGDVTLFHAMGISVNEYPSGGRDKCNLTQRQILERVIETATTQLAILALEEK